MRFQRTGAVGEGVSRDMPRQSHFHFSFILAKPGVSRDFFQGRVDATVDNYLSKQLQDLLHTSTQDMKKQGNYFKYHLMPLLDIHLHSNKSYEFEANGNINYVTIFSFVVAGSGAMLIALLTVSVQTVRAALANPVKSLRTE